MSRKLTLYVVVSILLLSSCGVKDDSNPHSNISDTSALESIVTSTQKNEIRTPSEQTIKSPETQSHEPIVTSVVSTEEKINPVFINDEHHGANWNDLTLPVYYYYTLSVTEGFAKLIEVEEYNDWLNNVVEERKKFAGKREELYVSWVDLSDYHNLYTFICEFNLSEQQIREALYEWNEFGVADMVEKYIYSEEEIEAISTKNKEEITRLFATSLAIVKGDKIYVPGWFFYNSAEDYQKADITAHDLITVLNNCRNYKFYMSEQYFWEDSYTGLYFLDLIEYKAYHYLNGDVDIIVLCGYDRDFDMPMAYEGYYWSLYESYIDFFNLNRDDDNGFNIIKNETTYSPHWVYYNKPTAYIEAGITPEELIEMLPKYEALGILTDEAWAALQGKIYAYADAG
ncbi:MAG: hypothetical protein FWG70_03635 [Oscillospiraceae bacterium]|nr:hypothetical protein [Oscillospiraceae bacterium]